MINWGVLGLGNMGRQFINCFLNKFSEVNLLGVASKSNSDVSNLKKKINFKQYNSYETLLEDDKIDAIYISTLNNTHKELVKSAAKKNKKILCEKPLGLNFKEVKDLHKILKENSNSFYEAIAYRSHPQTFFLMNLIKNKEFGKVKKIESNFGFKVKKISKDSRLFNKSLGGGAILDIGCYPISFFNLFNEQKNRMKILDSKVNYCETEVDIDAEIVLKINQEIDAKAKVSLRENLQNISRIFFENAVVTIPEPWIPKKKCFIEIETKSRYHKNFFNTDKNIYGHQIEQVSRAFLKKNDLLVDIDESLEISSVINSWLEIKS